MAKSIIQEDESYCYIHRHFFGFDVPAVHEHHCIHGTANRKWSEKWGLKVYLCLACHSALHDKHRYDLEIEQIAEKAWLEHNNKSVDEWIKIFGKNFL